MDIMQVLALVIPAAIYAGVPLILTALGGLFSERAGVVNIGLEGLMISGAFIGIVSTLWLEGAGVGAASPWIALIIAAIVGSVFALFHAVASISFRADQIVSGVAINFLALGLAIFLTRLIFGRGQTDYIQNRIFRTNVSGLSEIPIIGPLFFSNAYVTSYVALALVFVVYYIIFYTPFGLRLRSVGEHPMAADTMGVNVNKMRYVAVMLSGAFGALGGAVFAVTVSGNFSATTIVGQGFMALAVLIFGRWNPLGVLGAGLFFGLAQALSTTGAQLPFFSEIHPVFLLIAPYVLTIIALTGFVGKNAAPKAIGKPYIKGSR
ncbi:ABC transporter permease [Alkalihalobacillus sp. 1P02AB]|uniref:ABC transporter permease n=1 Tax=Alkalihalobacillus sp. 1P02AB TaxID=3132260 RepID=UPI0039A720D0